MFNHTATVLHGLCPRFWTDLAARSRAKDNWEDKEWWNIKYYLRTDDNDGRKPQVGMRGEIEVPYERRVFHPSPGRFSLSSGPVAYFSGSHLTNCLETISQFRDGPLSLADLDPYLSGQLDPDSRYYGYTITFKVSDGALLLDMTDELDPLIRSLEAGWGGCYYDDVLLSPSESVYGTTQLISDAIQQNGFDGIVYRSVRVPSERRYNGLILPDENLVIFSEAMVHAHT